MSKISKRLFAAVGAFAILGVAMAAPEAQARPQYLKSFVATYPNLTDAAKIKKCGICHAEAKDKKPKNDYGKAVGAGIGGKNEKDGAKIAAGLKKAESAKGSDGTYGEMIKAGKLPE